ncbi:GEVED domain-containing protein [Flavobacterium solisilvae]|uniref:Fibronectin type-III domain-containing protein n=1 Tax=Flavobacterium solisilvae TaxID=1852019 RepID=A0ABX1QTS2_9FLAO|nr:GEVED domain-containing protein [Flavobacterium solisilvae]NMH25627.1 hypothetical protein [Flavobacterium solisilvae]
MNKTTYCLGKNAIGKLLFTVMFIFAFAGVSSGQTITITQSSSGITAGNYDSGMERTWTQNSVSFGGKALFKESNQARLQLQASNGVIYNTTALPGRITGITINQYGTARNYNLSGGTSRLVNNTSGNYTVSGTAVGSAGTSWGSTAFTSTNYTFFAIKLAVSNASYITSVVITYETTPSCTAPLTQATNFSGSAIGQNTATIGWSRGNGNEVLVVARAGSAVNTDPISGTNYTANAAFGSVDTQIGTGNYVVYKGVGTSVNLTSLTAGTTYHFAVYEYNTTGICFNTTELIGSVTTNQPPSLTITGSLSENTTLNGGQVTLTLANETFSDNSLLQSNFTLNNAPAGVTISNVQYSSPTSAIVTLAYDGTDFDTSVTNFNIAINSDELSVSTSTLNSNSLTITAVNETLTVGNMSSGFGDQCVNVLSNYRTFTISSSTVLKAGTISLATLNGFTYSETADNEEYTTTLSFTHAGGTLASKTIYVKFKPTVTTPAYSGNISITATSTTPVQTQATATRSVSGTGTNGTVSVATKTATTITHNSVSFGGTSVSTTCGTITAKGVVWGTTESPTIALETKTNEGAGTANYDSNITGLYPNTQYFYRAYATNSNGVTSYGENNNFTTALAPCNPETFSAGTAQASATTIVSGGSTNLSLTGASAASGLSYQWQRLTNGEWSDISLATNATYSATNITANTSYRCKVTCGEITKESASVVVSLTYCTPMFSGTSDFIVNFGLETITNNGSGFSIGGYGNFTHLLTNLTENTNYNASLTSSSGSGNHGVAIWIDFNDNKIFETGERVGTLSNVAQNQTVSVPITIPTGNIGVHRMRVIYQWNVAGNSITPCVSASYGEVEDYTVNIQAPPPALTVSPTSLSGFNYVVGNGASAPQSFEVSGTNLNGDDVELLVDSAFEISENENSGYAEDITLTAYDGSSKDIWVRLKAGQSVNSYNGSVLISGGGDSVTYEVSLSGNVYNTVDHSKLDWPMSGTIPEGEVFDVFIKAYEPGVTDTEGNQNQISAWVGYSNVSDTDNPNGENWTWIPAGFNSRTDGNSNYQYAANMNINPLPVGTYYYAARFQMGENAPYTYGGIQSGNNGGNWNGSTYKNGTLTITSNLVDWCNVQHPLSGTITQCDDYNVYARVYEDGLTTVEPNTENGNASKIQAWIGYSTTDNNPSNEGWTWIAATYNAKHGNNYEYTANLNGENLPAGTYYYASRFQKTGSTEYRYGGTNNNFWTTSGTLTINALTTPTATVATNVTDESFTANWNAVTGATSYELDVWSVGGTEAPELVKNGDFETGDRTDWEGAGNEYYVINTDTPYSGNNYVKRTVPEGSGATYRLEQTASVEIGKTYKFSFWYKDYLAANTNGLKNYTIQGTSGSIYIDSGNPKLPAASEWTKYEKEFTATQSSIKISIRSYEPVSIDGISLKSTDSSIENVSVTGNFPSFIMPAENPQPETYSHAITGLNDNTTYHYVVRAINGACETVSSNEITVRTSVIWNGTAWSNTAGPDETIDAIIEGEYITNEDGEFAAKSLIVRNNTITQTNGSLTVSNEDVVTVIGALHNQTGSATAVTIESGAVLLQNGTTNTNTGNITVKRNSSAIKRLDYTLWSSPVAGQEIYAFSPTTLKNRFYTYNTATDAYSAVPFTLTNLQYPAPMTSANTNDGINGTDTSNIQFATAKGYLIRVPWDHPTAPAVFAGQFTGVPNSGDITVEMSLAGAGYNAVGNPYPSKINIAAFLNANDDNTTKTLYFWRKTNNASETTYATINEFSYAGNQAPGGNVGGNSEYFDGVDFDEWAINVGQGFFVQASPEAIEEDSDDSKKLYFTNAMRRSQINHDQFFRTSSTNETQGLLWLNLLSASNPISQISVGYSTAATLEVDRGIDGKNINTDMYLASLIDGEGYAIQGRPSFEDTDEVPLSYKVATAGNHSIAIDHVSGIFADGQEIYLKDNLLGTIHNLTNGGAYNFTTNAGTFSERFEVVYANSALGVDKPTFNENQVVVYKNENSQFVVNTGNVEMSSIKVFDLRGRLLTTQDDINASQTNLQVDVATQVLLLQITSVDGMTVTKKIIK